MSVSNQEIFIKRYPTSPSPTRATDTCENITFPQRHWQTVNMAISGKWFYSELAVQDRFYCITIRLFYASKESWSGSPHSQTKRHNSITHVSTISNMYTCKYTCTWLMGDSATLFIRQKLVIIGDTFTSEKLNTCPVKAYLILKGSECTCQLTLEASVSDQ